MGGVGRRYILNATHLGREPREDELRIAASHAWKFFHDKEYAGAVSWANGLVTFAQQGKTGVTIFLTR